MSTDQSSWPSLAEDHILLKFHARLPKIIEEAGHSDIWGVKLSTAEPPEFSTLIILQKYLRSTSNDLEKSVVNLTKTLKWRKEFGLDKKKEQGTEEEEDFGPDFDGLGYVTKVGKDNGRDDIVTWNVYGAVKDLKKPFGDLQRFLRWRIGLMEKAISYLHLEKATIPIHDSSSTATETNNIDIYKIDQIHLYGGVSFLRMDPLVKSASKATIEIFQNHYPELLLRKFFVQVPLIMSWMFTAISLFVSVETSKKFQVISYPTNLAKELGNPNDIPKELGGNGPDLKMLQQRLEGKI
ncbi:uncharacterized protein L201_006983 [Kwoniella dendrophila CBS 6074]|uniref:Phosphatidylinositol transfer protein SFH5 n=1 Tax=Kwoniella dendrophila CBS 6074 TaxID=1295534 RepID=A0AAX4K4C3_9TREE